MLSHLIIPENFEIPFSTCLRNSCWSLFLISTRCAWWFSQQLLAAASQVRDSVCAKNYFWDCYGQDIWSLGLLDNMNSHEKVGTSNLEKDTTQTSRPWQPTRWAGGGGGRVGIPKYWCLDKISNEIFFFYYQTPGTWCVLSLLYNCV